MERAQVELSTQFVNLEFMEDRIIFFGNNWLGWKVLEHLLNSGENVVALVVHPLNKRKCWDEIHAAINGKSIDIIDGKSINNEDVHNKIRTLNPTMGFSVLFDYLLHSDLIGLFSRGVINLHPSYLPYNRGQYPNVWSIIEGTPAGATLHYIDNGIDTGDIIESRLVEVEPIDTGETLYRKLENASLELFKDTWPRIKNGNINKHKNEYLNGTYHRTNDVNRIDEIDMNKKYVAKDLINILRARTFLPYAGAYYIDNGKKVYLRLQLEYDDEQE